MILNHFIKWIDLLLKRVVIPSKKFLVLHVSLAVSMFIQVEPVRPSVLDVLVCCVDMVLNTEWVQIEAIDLSGDGSGWGFGITGGRSTGVVVKTVVPGSVADKDGRLQIGDHIIQIGDINLRGMGSEQVAMVLRQSGPQVHLIVARPVEPSSPEDSLMQSGAPIVPTRLLSEPEELEQQLNIFHQSSNGFSENFLPNNSMYVGDPDPAAVSSPIDLGIRNQRELMSLRNRAESVEMEKFEVNLVKDYKGLGIIVAGYVCEREDISGIFVKSIAKGSVADLCGQIRVHDQVVEVDGHPLKGYSNCEAVEILRNTGKHVKLQLARYHHGAKFEHLQEAMGADKAQIVRTEQLHDITSPRNVRSASSSHEVKNSAYSLNAISTASLKAKWQEQLGPKHDIIIAELSKSEDEVGFGFNVESTEEEELNIVIRHFISDICKGHSLDRNSSLYIGDELLEVNGKPLRGQKYSEVLSVFKSLPLDIVLTCARSYYGSSSLSLIPWADRLLKAKSDSYLFANKYCCNRAFKNSGRSLEHLSSIATWSSEPYFVDLVKDENGLGFSIVEYKDPLLPNVLRENVIVVWSLVPGAAAQIDGRLLPGDRLLSVNNINFRHTDISMATQILKYIPKGSVRLGVAKPTALSKSVPAEIASAETFVKDPSVIANGNRPTTFVHNGICHPPPTEAYSYATRSQTPSSMLSFGFDSRCSTPFSSPGFSPGSRGWGFDVSLLPAALERVVKIKKGTNKLGLILDLVDRGQNGMVVKSIRPASAVEKDGSIQHGDYILGVNSENMRNITRSQARAIIRRAELTSSDIVIKYIPASDAAVHQQSAVLAKMHQGMVSPTPSIISRQPSPRSPYFSHKSTKTTPDGDETDGQISPFSFLSEDEALPTPSSHGYTDQFDSSSEDLLDQISEPFPSLEGIKGNDPFFPSIEERIANFHSKQQVPSKFNKMSTSPTVSPVQDESPPLLKSPDLPVPPEPPMQPDAAEVPENPSMLQVTNNSPSPRLSVSGSQWAPQREVELCREPGQEIGIGVVMGCIDAQLNNYSETLSGVFIKNVVPDSPAGRCGKLSEGDRIIEVNDIDLRAASYAEAIDVIQKCGNSIKFVVQSLVPWFNSDANPSSAQVTLSPSPSGLNRGVSQEKLQRRSVSEDEETDFNEDYQGRVYTAKGVEIDRSSAGYIKLTPEELADEPDEDEFGYTPTKIKKKYSPLKGTVVLVEIEKGPYGLGLSLAGNKNRSKMSTFVCGMHPRGNAAKTGLIEIGDELLEVNGKVLFGRCHLNVSAIIRGICIPTFKIIILRRSNGVKEMAVKPITHFTIDMEDTMIENLMSSYPGVRTVTTKKGDHGLGIMILEGKHVDMGQGIFISDIQKGSPAEQSGLSVGDMILAVNKTNLIGADYEQAATVLKNADGHLSFLVINSSKTLSSPMRNNIIKSPKESIPEVNIESLITEPKVKSRSSSPLPPPSPVNQGTASSPLPVCPIPPPVEFSDSIPGLAMVETSGREMLIDVIRGHSGLGLSVIGGTDTPLRSIIVQEIYPNGAVAQDGRLKPGDQILEVSGQSIRNSTHQEAVNRLRHNTNVVSLLIFRHAKDIESSMLTFEVEFSKKPGKGLGLCIVGKHDGHGVYISEVVPGGLADVDGRLMAGDQIMKINDQDLTQVSQEAAASIIKTTLGRICLTIGRYDCESKKNSPTEKLQ